MKREIRTVNFGTISQEIAKTRNEVIEAVGDDFDPDGIEVLEQYDKIIDFVKRKGKVLFLTGKAGTGKSTAIRYVKHMIPKSVVVAPTTIAAENVKGSTVHSFFGFPPRLFNPEDISVPKSKVPIIQDLDLLIVDEVSMISSTLVDAMNIALRQAKNSNQPFGGIPVLFVGDLFQLPPIVENEEIRKYFSGVEERYDTEFFFSADVLKEDNVEVEAIELEVVRRQDESSSKDNKHFVEALNNIRTETGDIFSCIDFLNEKCFEAMQDDPFDNAIALVPTKSKARSINKNNIAAIESESRMYKGHCDSLTSEDIKRFQAPDELELKVGAQVVFVHNNKPDWINGDLGTVTAMYDNRIEVRIHKTGYVRDVTREEFGKYRYHYNTEKKKIELKLIGKFIQFPLALGWAITIHKSQGMTLEKAIVDIDGNAFADGQTYVALSRVKSIEGLKLGSELTYGDVQVNKSILRFYSMIFPESYQCLE
jgi:ATP-dependent exoDNAse (exonuclease V) alpha subunit